MSEHVFLHITSPPHLFVTNMTLVITTNIVALGHVVLVVSLVVKFRLTPLACKCFRFTSAYFLVGSQIAIRDELLFATLALESFPLGKRNVFFEMSHDLKQEYLFDERIK